MTTECTEPEFTNLKEELEELGYRLNVVDGCTKEHQDARQRAFNDAMTTAQVGEITCRSNFPTI
jgi:hypothetical protein